MWELNQLVVFILDEQKYGLDLSTVERVIPAVEVIALPSAPEVVLGVINMQGRIVPVVDIRKRFRLPEREIDPGHQLIIANTTKRPVALVVDSVRGVVDFPEQEAITAQSILPHLVHVEGVIKLEGGMVFIHNLDKFLSLEEEQALSDAMREA